MSSLLLLLLLLSLPPLTTRVVVVIRIHLLDNLDADSLDDPPRPRRLDVVIPVVCCTAHTVAAYAAAAAPPATMEVIPLFVFSPLLLALIMLVAIDPRTLDNQSPIAVLSR